jgi:predicted dinucleotide-binding enzyme
MTTIVVLGASNIGATLARKCVSAGHRVTLAATPTPPPCAT